MYNGFGWEDSPNETLKISKGVTCFQNGANVVDFFG